MDKKDYYVVLTGAKKNIGDFLITYRCEELLKHIRKDRELIKYPSWENLEDKIDVVNSSKAIIILGGPGYQENMYPNVYPLVQDMKKIKVPIIFMGLGAYLDFGDFENLSKFKFSPNSKLLLEKSSKKFPLGCRDYMSQNVMLSNQISNTIMTGCPVWYDIDSLNKSMEIKNLSEIKNIVFTTPQNPIFEKQCVEMMKLIKNRFPKSKIYSCFHRGLGEVDRYTSQFDADYTKRLSEISKSIGIIPRDVSKSLDDLNFYDDCDLHIGYRVHGHIYFLSKRKLSICLNEDARGMGMCEAINIPSINCFKKTYIIGSDGVFNMTKTVNENAVLELDMRIVNEIKNNFVRYNGLDRIIDENYKIMELFVNKLP